MPNIILIGGQWGDEGKGKVVDLITPHFDIVARYSGGPNAGHTVRRGETKYALRHIPSGILTPSVTCLIGNGAVIDPNSLMEEIRNLKGSGVSVDGRLLISNRAHVILPQYVDWETRREESPDAQKIGTTRRGVGPAYAAKIARAGLRVADLYHPATLRARLTGATALFANGAALGHGILPAAQLDELADVYTKHAESLRPYVADTGRWLDEKIRAGSSVLFEGAQGTMLDIDHGTYPYVTSSNSTAGGACTGLGIGPTALDGVLAIYKAYSTRVGEGPFVTEEKGAAGDLIRERGREYGTVTGRPRRCGWFDAVAARYAARINGVDCVALTLLDVLDAFDEIRICTGYRHQGKTLTEYPCESWILPEVEPVYTTIRGWKQDTTGCRSFDALPAEAQEYVRRIEDLLEVDVDLVSVAPTPEGSILREVSKLAAWLAAST